MNLPQLTIPSKQSQQITDFMGYNHNLVINPNQFYDTKNISPDLYPVMTVRKPRGTYKKLEKPNGLYAKEYLAYVDGDAFYYNNRFICLVEDSKKQFVSMGAYLVMFPDKIAYNTFSDEVIELEARYENTGSVTIEKANLTDSTSTDASISVYCKISMAGIGKNFNLYDGVFISGLEEIGIKPDAGKVIQEINDDYIMIIQELEETKTFSKTIKVERRVPDMDYVTEMMNRLWGCSSDNHEVYSCSIGEPWNWNRFEGIASDSYAATIGSDGKFTGAVTYLGYVFFFKEDTIHMVQGSKPSNYQISQSQGRGIEAGSENSVSIVNETLYYNSRNGIVQFQGNAAQPIADPFGNIHYKNAVGCRKGNKYYVSMQDEKEEWFLFVYDETKQIWIKEDNTHALYMAFLDNNLWYIDEEGYLKTIEGADDETIQWEAQTGDILISMNKKYLTRLDIRIDLSEGSFMDIWVSYDDDQWQRVKTISAVKHRSYQIPIRPKRADHMRILMKGSGNFKLYQIDKYFQMGSVKR